MVTAEELYELQEENIRLKEEVEALQAEVETFPRMEGSEYGSFNDLAYHAAAGSLDKQPHQDGRVESAIEDATRYVRTYLIFAVHSCDRNETSGNRGCDARGEGRRRTAKDANVQVGMYSVRGCK